ncbi:MAG: VCBS repeat domain-containing M23 family metallopeptidase [Candidatus Kerfeldbacteria bacterium]|nr:VCBS repeat domain-containing M23 family metallopeptidase [Candidatus Kerfeldbacteria bacterium]
MKVILSALIGLLLPALAHASANYIYPLDYWAVSTQHGEAIGDGLYHMGVDAGFSLPAGTPVYATAAGIVREAQERSQFGLVVLIEHNAGSDQANVSLYGHLRPSDVRVTPGDTVQAGDIIGVLGDESENGGWSVHLHFGIHKTAYTGDWVYYGHVHDSTTAEQWFDPEHYIPNHLTDDHWLPQLTVNVESGQVVTNTPLLTITPRDLGSGVQLVRWRVRTDTTQPWTSISSTTTITPSLSIPLDLTAWPDGNIWLRVVVRDNAHNKAVKTVRLVKDPERLTTPAFISGLAGNTTGTVQQWSFAETVLNTFTPFEANWNNGVDVAATSQHSIVGRGSSTAAAEVAVFSPTGYRKTVFEAFAVGTIRVATGDIDGDDNSEIIVGSGKNQPATVKVFKRNGTLVWAAQPFGSNVISGVDVAAGDTDGDGQAEIIVGTRAGTATRIAIISHDGQTVKKIFPPFQRKFTGGVNVTSADIDGDNLADIVVGTESGRVGTVRLFSGRGKKLGYTWAPFGEAFVGSIDVATLQWDDNTGARELLFSQASIGQAWVKAYRLQADLPVVLNQLVADPSITTGARIDGWK